jgi:UBX domain-containing protein 7
MIKSCCFHIFQAKEVAKSENKWILVDLQNSNIFLSVVLNRDLWQSPALKMYIQENFLFLQVRMF